METATKLAALITMPVAYVIVALIFAPILYLLVSKLGQLVQVVGDLRKLAEGNQLSELTSRLKEALSLMENIANLEPKINKTLETVQGTQSRIKMLETEVGAQGAAIVGDVAASPWNKIRRIWQQTKARVEVRAGGTYDGILRYSYNDLVIAMQSDGRISEKDARSLLEMNKLFLARRPTGSASSEDADQFQRWFDDLSI